MKKEQPQTNNIQNIVTLLYHASTYNYNDRIYKYNFQMKTNYNKNKIYMPNGLKR